MHISEMVAESYQTAAEHGWWPAGEAPNIPEKLALIHSEVSEALEEIRNGNPPTFLYFNTPNGKETFGNVAAVIGPLKPEGFPSELADVLIRIGDLCGYLGIDLEAAVKAKLAYNKTRAFRHGGKTC